MTVALDYERYSLFPVDNLPLGVGNSEICIRVQIEKEQFRVHSVLLHFP